MSTPPPPTATRRRRRLWWLVPIAIVVVPLVEIWVLWQVGQLIGVWWTIVLLVVDSIVGGWLLRHQGSRAWRGLQEALTAGRIPGREIADGVLVLIGGTLLLTPGFISDVAGLLLLVPVTRPLFRRVLATRITRRLLAPGGYPWPPGGPGPPPSSPGAGPGPQPGPDQGPVVPGDVVDEDRN